jgi:vacuolar protein sorting-associated protein 13A/C
MAKIINNVQIHIKNIHLRYEDHSSTPEHPFAAGVTLSEFKMVSTDEYWLEAFITSITKDVHKVGLHSFHVRF